jgi:DNA-binding response OmpR family regulator
VEFLKQNDEVDKDINYKTISVEVSTRKVFINKRRIDLTPKEFDLLYLLASHPGRVYSRENLLNIIWGYQHKGYEHTVNSHINRLRIKIEKNISDPQFILTSWGLGYRFNDQLI